MWKRVPAGLRFRKVLDIVKGFLFFIFIAVVTGFSLPEKSLWKIIPKE